MPTAIRQQKLRESAFDFLLHELHASLPDLYSWSFVPTHLSYSYETRRLALAGTPLRLLVSSPRAPQKAGHSAPQSRHARLAVSVRPGRSGVAARPRLRHQRWLPAAWDGEWGGEQMSWEDSRLRRDQDDACYVAMWAYALPTRSDAFCRQLSNVALSPRHNYHCCQRRRDAAGARLISGPWLDVNSGDYTVQPRLAE